MIMRWISDVPSNETARPTPTARTLAWDRR
jgi:hypothetical protein